MTTNYNFQQNIKRIFLYLLASIFFACGFQHRDIQPAETPKNIYVAQKQNYFYYLKYLKSKNKGQMNVAIQYLIKAIEFDPESIHLNQELLEIYIKKNQYEKALKVAERMLVGSPENVEVLIQYGRIKQMLNQSEDAKVAFQKVIDLDPQQKRIYLILGRIYMDADELDEAHRVYQQLITHFPNSYVGYFYLGKIEKEKNNDSDALKYFNKTLEIEPELIEPRFEILSIYRKKKDTLTPEKIDEIIGLLNEIRRENPSDLRPLFELGVFYHEIDRKKEAEKIFKQLGQQSLTDQSVFRGIVQQYINGKKFQNALILIKGILKESPGQSSFNYLAGECYRSLEQNDNAIKYFKEVGPSSRFYDNSVPYIAFHLQEQGKIQEAVDYLNEVITQHRPKNVNFKLYLGSFYEEIKELQQAETQFREALAIKSNNYQLRFRLGVVLDKMGKKEDAIEQMKLALQIEPNNANALNYLGYTWADMGINLEEAEKLVKKALVVKPNDGYITDSLGWIYFRMNRISEAITLLEQAVELEPEDPIVLEHLGDAYLNNNDTTKALDAYQRALKKKKDDTEELEEKIKKILSEKSNSQS